MSREQRWSAAFAERVEVEYRRFLYLAKTSVVSTAPSPLLLKVFMAQVADPGGSWDRMFAQVLNRPSGSVKFRSPASSERELSRYRQTLGLYRREFGEEAPADIWQPAEQIIPATSEETLAARRRGTRGTVMLVVLALICMAGSIATHTTSLGMPLAIVLFLGAIALAVRTRRLKSGRVPVMTSQGRRRD